MRKNEKSDSYKDLKRTFEKMVQGILFLYLICLFAIAFPDFAGGGVYTVLSGSMEPSVSVGGAVYVKQRDCRKIKKGDVITYYLDGLQVPVTHRVIAVDRKNRTFRTKGDANDVPDLAEVKWENVRGVVLFSIPLIGYLRSFLSDFCGKMAALSVLAGLLVGCLLFQKDTGEKEVVRHEG